MSRPGRRAATGPAAPKIFGALLAVALVAGMAGCGGSGDAGGDGAGEDEARGPAAVKTATGSGHLYEFTVPAGTADRLAAGEDVAVLPSDLNLEVGDSLRIVNEDVIAHTVGPWHVTAGGTIDQSFNSPTVLEGVCTVHPDGAVRIEVGAPR